MNTSGRLSCPSLKDLENWTVSLSKIAAPPLVILLEGELGTGKTQFARFFINSFGISNEEIMSPSFALAHHYEIKSETTSNLTELYHFDLYRLENLAEIEGTGFWDVFSLKHVIALVEWSNKIDQALWPKSWSKWHLQFFNDHSIDYKLDSRS